MASKEWAKRVVVALHALGKRRFGALAEAEKAVKVFPSYVRKRKDAGTIDLRKMLSVLEALGGHPGRFFRHVFPMTEAGISRYLDAPHGPMPPIVASAYERLRSERPSSITVDHLIHLDAFRYEQPSQVVRSTEEALPFLSPENVPLGLGVWASAQRSLLFFDEAIHALFAAMTIAEQHNDLGAFADLLIRLSYIVGDSGDFDQALFLAREATDYYVRSGDLSGVGRSLVDRGVRTYYLGRHRDAIALLEQGLPLLPEDAKRYRATVFQVLGLTHLALGDLDTTAVNIEKALPEAKGLGPLIYGKTLWLEASLYFAQQKFEESESVLRDVVAQLSSVHAGETALATIDLALAQLEAGTPASALESVRAILPLIATLGGNNKIVRSAERVLVDLVSQATVTLGSLDELRSLVQSLQRERHLWRSLEKRF